MNKREIIFHQLVRESTGCASYVIGSRETRKCILVDPIIDTERFEFFLAEKGYEAAIVVDTHTHADHLSGLRYFSSFPKPELAMHESSPGNFEFRRLKDGEVMGAGKVFDSGYEIKVIYTPGHTTDHICLLGLEDGREKFLLSGDSLFIGDVGRTDLGRGDNDQMYETLFQKILKLDPQTEVYPAHVGAKHFLGSEALKTTIAIEKENNPALQNKSKDAFKKYMTEGWPPKPPFYQEIIDINLGRVSLLDVQEKIASYQSSPKPRE